MIKVISFTLFIILLHTFENLCAQTIIANFISPDTVCVNETVTITNITTGGSTYYWNFCSGNTNNDPTGVNIGNPGGLLSIPTYITLVKEGNDCFSFISCQGVGVIRYFHGVSFANDPLSWTNLGTFGLINFNQEGIQVKYDNGEWYGFVCSFNTLIRLNFGASLWNIPTATNIGPFTALNMPHGLEIIKEGTTWIGFTACSSGNKLVRFNFGSSLANIPTLYDFGNMGVLNSPTALSIILENSQWYLLVSAGSNNLARFSFGSSLLNTPTAQNLGNPGGFNSTVGLTFLRDCESTTGYFVNYLTSGQLGKLTFSNGVAGAVTGTILGNIGNLNQPHSFSEIFRQNDTLYAYITNRGSGTLTRLSFPPCSNASIPSSTLFNPPSFSYNTPGTYNIRLLVNEGLPNQASLCKNIVVGPAPVVNLGNDQTICPGITTTLDAGAGFSNYLWSTGATTQTIVVGTPGSYWVQVTNYGCEDYDTVNVSLYTVAAVSIGPDTTICEGSTYTFDAGFCTGCSYIWSNLTMGQPNIGTGFSFTTGTAGTYMVTKSDANGCIKRDTATLSLTPPPVITTNPLSQTICSGNQTNILLTANLPGTTFSWTASCTLGNVTGFANGTGNAINQMLTNNGTTPGVVSYIITPALGNCIGQPVIYNVLVNPAPVVTNNPPGDSICSGDSTMILLQASISGSIFAWTAAGSSGSVTGYSSGSGDTINQVLINSSYTNQSVTYSVSATAMGCTGPQSDYTVVVHPEPDAFFVPAGQSFCSGDTTLLSIQSNVTGCTFNWTASGSSGNVTGFSNGTGNEIVQILINSGSETESVTYVANPSANGCPGISTSGQVMVYPIPDVYFNPVIDITCSGDTNDIELLSHVSGSSFSWSATSSSPFVTGFYADTGARIRQAIFNSGTTPASVTYHVTPNANGCVGVSDSISLVVKPRPDISFLPSSLSICSGITTSISISSQTPGTTFSWTALGSSPDVTGYADGSGVVISQTLTNIGFREEQVTYAVTPEAEGCTGTDSIYIVTVFPVADVVFSPPGQTICSGQSSSIALGSNVTGTTFSWNATGSSTNVSGYSAGSGALIAQNLVNSGNLVESVTYTVFPVANNCSGTPGSVVVGISPPPIVSLSLCHDTLTTTNAQPIYLRGGIPLKGTYSGAGISNGILYPALAGTGTLQITYSYTNMYGCESNASQTITIVNPIAHICGDSITDIRDGQTYPTIQIGSQCGLAKSLNYGIRSPSSFLQRDNCIPEKFCLQELTSKCNQYGGLYQWDELMTYTEMEEVQGLCPPGWHIPSESEWEIIFAYYINNAFAASPLLYSGYSGYNAPLSGTRFINLVWDFEGFATMLWSSTSHGTYKAWAHGMNDYDHGVSYYPAYRLNAFSVRCLKD